MHAGGRKRCQIPLLCVDSRERSRHCQVTKGAHAGSSGRLVAIRDFDSEEHAGFRLAFACPKEPSQPVPLSCIIILIVVPSRSTSIAFFLLCIMALVSSQLLLPLPAAAGSVPAACHQHGRHAPSPMPASHQCCVMGHAPSVLPTYAAQGSHDFTFRVLILPDRTSNPQEIFSATSMRFSADSPPIAALRI
jgi:hypothetical protein